MPIWRENIVLKLDNVRHGRNKYAMSYDFSSIIRNTQVVIVVIF